MKMTREDKIKAFAMRLDGHMFQEIADEFGVSRQYIQQMLSDEAGGHKKVAQCIFPGIERWMRENNCTAYMLNKKMGLWLGRTSNFYMRLNGKIQFTLDEIKVLLDVTGMTFDEAFC